MPPAAHCGPTSVYGPSAPGDSAFVRMVNAVAGGQPLAVSLGATRFESVKYAEASPYRPVVPDIYLLRVSGLEREIVAKTKSYFTIVFTQRGIHVLEDVPHTDPARAQVFLYNFSSLPRLDLKTSDGKTSVIAGVQSGASGVTVVNAVAASLAVFGNGVLVTLLGDLGLRRGSSFSVFALGEDAPPLVFAVKAEVRVK